MKIKEIKKSLNKYHAYALVLLLLIVAYLYLPYYSWLPTQTVIVGEGGISEEIADSYSRNMLYKLLGEFGNLFFFTVQTFYTLVFITALYGFNKSERVRMWVNFLKIHASLVAILFIITIMPSAIMAKLWYTLVIETVAHLLIPAIYIYATRGVKFRKLENSVYSFMIIPMLHYYLNWALQIGSGFRAWTYPFFNFGNPMMMDFATPVKVLFNIATFGVLITVFIVTWKIYEKKKAD